MKQPNLSPISDDEYELLEDYIYTWVEESGPDKDKRFRLVIPRGFVTDIASVPQMVWTVTGIRPDGLHRAAAVVHDFLYKYRGHLPHGALQIYFQGEWIVTYRQFKRRKADKMFVQIMKEAGVKFKRHVMYWSVRAFGSLYWYT